MKWTQNRKEKRKLLGAETIECLESPDPMSSSCFLATFYFTQKLLPDLMRKQEARGAENVDVKELTDFIVRYGSYLKMHTCLAYATVLKAQTVILELLQMAKHDPVHRQGLSQIMNGEALTVYEPVSNLVLRIVQHEISEGTDAIFCRRCCRQ